MTPSPLLSCASTTGLDIDGAMTFTPRVDLLDRTVSSGAERALLMLGQDRMQQVRMALGTGSESSYGHHAARGGMWRRSIRSSDSTTGLWTASCDFCKREIAASFRSAPTLTSTNLPPSSGTCARV